MDDYLKYTGVKETVYTGKVDSMIFRSGRDRIIFTGLLISDPNINKVSIYWDNKTDSVIIPVQRSSGIDSLWQEIPLNEGSYNFQVYTADSKGNSSIVTNMAGRSYGAGYESGLYPRPVKSIVQYPDYALIEWYNADPTSFVRVDYANTNDDMLTVIVPPEKDTTMLLSNKPLSRIKLQTLFMPDQYAVDTFSVAAQYIGADADVTTNYIKNSGAGNVGIEGNFLNGNNEWGEPIDWIVTDPIKVNAHQHGWANRDGGVLHPETWGSGDFENGKIYQTVILPQGKYELSYYCVGSAAGGNDWSRINAYFVAARGAVPPDIDDIDIEKNKNVLGFVHGNGETFRDWHTITFTLEEETEINIGFVCSLKNESQFRVKELKLVYKAQ
jgi:hypothetical protein